MLCLHLGGGVACATTATLFVVKFFAVAVIIALSPAVAGCGRDTSDDYASMPTHRPGELPPAGWKVEPEDLTIYSDLRGGDGNLAGAYTGVMDIGPTQAIRVVNGELKAVPGDGKTRYDLVLFPDGTAYTAYFDSEGRPGPRHVGYWSYTDQRLKVGIKEMVPGRPDSEFPVQVIDEKIIFKPDHPRERTELRRVGAGP